MTRLQTSIKPLFKYAGSKQKMLPLYEPYFHPVEPFTRFVDLFAGGMSMTFWMFDHYPNIEYVVNDFNEELVLLYNTLQSHEDEVIKEWQKCVDKFLILTVEDRKTYYYSLREEYTLHYVGKPVTRLAGILLFMMQTNFNGMWVSYIKCNKRYSTSPGSCNQKAAFFDPQRIRDVAAFLRKAKVSCEDFMNVDIREGDFLYADPPYRDSRLDYKGDFGGEKQAALAEFLLNSGNLFAYSNKDVHDGWYEKHFPNTNIYDLTTGYGAGGAIQVFTPVSEVLITNFVPKSL